jgi:hypothetical protein
MSDQISMPDITDVAEMADDDDAGQSEPGRGGRLASIGAALAARLAFLAPIARIVGLVPRPILAGVGSAVAVLLIALAGASVFAPAGSRDVAHGSGISAEAASLTEEDEHELLTAPTARPAPTQRPAPTATPAPPVWQPIDGGGWVGIGVLGANRLELLRPANLLLLDDTRDSFTMTARVGILLSSGDLRPWWGLLLSYVDPTHNTRIEFFSDSYDQFRPYVGLFAANGNPGGPLEPPVRVPRLEFWGRDTHEVKVLQSGPQVRLQVDGSTVKTWTAPSVPRGGQKGAFIWGESRMRIDSLTVR